MSARQHRVSSPPACPKEAADGLAAGRPSGPAAFFFIVELPLPPKALSPNLNSRWPRVKATKSYRRDCGWVFKQALRSNERVRAALHKPVPVVLSMEYRCAKDAAGYVAHDTQNAIAAMKAGIDGMVDAGVIPTDSTKWLSWGPVDLVTKKREAAWKARGDGVTITIRSRA